jgi:hypothetical protein
MKQLAIIFLFGSILAVTAATASYWFQGFQRQPSAAAARAYLFQATNNPAAGDALRWNGTNLYWAP